MGISNYFGKQNCILDSIMMDNNQEAINAKLVNQIKFDFDAFNLNELKELSCLRDYSFNGEIDQDTPLQKFKKFMKKIEILSSNHRIYLLCIATFNVNGYIREEAVRQLSEYKSKIVLAFVLMRFTDWVDKVKNAALDTLEKILLDSNVTSIFELNKLTDYFSARHWLRSYSLYKPFFHQNESAILSILASVHDKAEAIKLWGGFERFISVNVQLFKVAMKSPFEQIRMLALANVPLTVINKKIAKQLEKLPSVYIKLLAPRLCGYYENPTLIRDSISIKKLIYRYLHCNDSSVRQCIQCTLKSEEIADVGDLYRVALQHQPIAPGTIRGLGETGNSHDIPTLIPFLQSARPKIRAATLYALLKLHYSKSKELIQELLENDKSPKVKHDALYFERLKF